MWLSCLKPKSVNARNTDSRAPLADLKRELEKYIGKLGTAIVDSSIQFAVNFMLQSPMIIDNSAV